MVYQPNAIQQHKLWLVVHTYNKFEMIKFTLLLWLCSNNFWIEEHIHNFHHTKTVQSGFILSKDLLKNTTIRTF